MMIHRRLRRLGPVLALLITSASGAYGEDEFVVSGYSALVSADRVLEYPSFLPRSEAGFSWRKKNKAVVWKTAPAGEARDTVFVFMGGQHHSGQCDLSINGAVVLSFRTSAKTRTVYCGPRASLLFDCKKPDDGGYTGIYYLRVDKSLIRPNQPQTLSVLHVAGSPAAWFAVWQRTDAIQLETAFGTHDDNLAMLADLRLEAPLRLDHSVGARVPLTVHWRSSRPGLHVVEVLAKDIFTIGFPQSVGKANVDVARPGAQQNDFIFKNLDPESAIWIFKATVKTAGEVVAHMETEALLGRAREDILATPPVERQEYSPSMTVKTPAFAFMKPWARAEPLKVFFMTPTNYDREIIELAQRMDLDYRTTFCHSRELKQDVCENYVKLMREAEPECIVMSAIFWRHMTPQLRKLILSRVAKGMGLVYIDPYHLDAPLQEAVALEPLTPDALTRGVPLKETGLLDAYGPPGQWIQCGQFGKGRIVFIKHKARLYKRGWNVGIDNFVPRRHPPFPQAFDGIVLRKDALHYYAMRNSLPADPFRAADDYSYAFLIRTMHWAAGLSDPIIRDVRVTSDQDCAAVAVVLDAGDKVRYRVRNRFGRVVATGRAGASFALESLGAGLHFMDVLALDADDSVIDFHTVTFESPGGDVAVSSFAPTSLFFIGDEPATFRAALTNRTNAGKSVRLRLSLVDVWGRIVARAERAVDIRPGTEPITWDIARPDTSASFAFRADLEIMNTGGRAACYVTFPDASRAVDEFTSRFWGSPRNQPIAWSKVARQDGHRGGTRYQAFGGALYGLRTSAEHYIPLYQRKSKDAQGKLRAYNLDDPGTRANTDVLLREKTKMLRPFGPHGYSLGHEASLSHVESSGHVVDYDFSEPTLAKFRTHLEKVHGNVAALNRVWASHFESFRDVMPSTYAEILPRRANLAPWMEHRTFMDRNFTDWLVYCAGKIRELDPQARVGITGIPGSGIGSFFGIDPYYIATEFNYLVQYSKKRAPLRMYLRYRQPGAVMGVFTGYDTTAPNRTYNETEAWRYLFMGCTEISYYHFSGMNGGYYQPDMTVSTSGDWLGKSLREIDEGPSKLFFGKPRAHHGVGIYFSQSSVHATTALGIPVFTQLNRQLESTVDNLERYGLSPAVISHHEVEAAPERLRDFRIVFFPLCASLSSKEMKAITAFVEAGGTAVVDSLFGLYTEDGRFMPDQVCPWFQPTSQEYLNAFDTLRENSSDGQLVLAGGERTVSVSTFRGIARRLRDGKRVQDAVFEKPEFFIESRAVGKGRVMHRTCFLPNNDTAALLLHQRVVNAGVEHPLTVRDDTGGLVAEIQMSHIQGDGKDYFGIVYGSWAGRFKKRLVLLTWRTKAHTYDVRTHRCLGEIDQHSIELNPARAMLFCRTPRRIGTFVCAAKATTVSRGGSIDVAIRQSSADEPQLLYRVWAETRKGQQPLAFARKVWVRGQSTVRIPVAYNDPGGAWKVHVREAITGRKQTLTVDVID